MRAAFLLLAFGLATVAAVPRNPQRIVGGSVTSIEQYPYSASLMYSWNLLTYHQSCGGAIINARAILSAAHCFTGDTPPRWRVRIGSTMANSGGVVHHLSDIILHPQYGVGSTYNNDVAILHLASFITYNDQAQPTSIAAPSYNLPDGASVWAIGWGRTTPGGVQSEQLRHVEVWTVNQAVCRTRYAELGGVVTNEMLCSGWLDVGGRDQCQGDSGGPLVHNNVIVGVCSWGQSCALERYPGVNARVSRFSNWIQANA